MRFTLLTLLLNIAHCQLMWHEQAQTMTISFVRWDEIHVTCSTCLKLRTELNGHTRTWMMINAVETETSLRWFLSTRTCFHNKQANITRRRNVISFMSRAEGGHCCRNTWSRSDLPLTCYPEPAGEPRTNEGSSRDSHQAAALTG